MISFVYRKPQLEDRVHIKTEQICVIINLWLAVFLFEGKKLKRQNLRCPCHEGIHGE